MSNHIDALSESVFAEIGEQVKGTIIGRPLKLESLQAKVDLKSEVLVEYARELTTSLNLASDVSGGSLHFTEEEMLQYCRTLVVFRVNTVNHDNPKIHWKDRVCVPSFLSLVLNSIGKVSDDTLGLEIKPVVEPEKGDIMSKDDALAFSRRLYAMKTLGFSCADALPRSHEGSWEFMTMVAVDDQIMHHSSDSHPVYAMLSSVVQLKGLLSVMNPRITYGNTEMFKRMITRFAVVKGV